MYSPPVSFKWHQWRSPWYNFPTLNLMQRPSMLAGTCHVPFEGHAPFSYHPPISHLTTADLCVSPGWLCRWDNITTDLMRWAFLTARVFLRAIPIVRGCCRWLGQSPAEGFLGESSRFQPWCMQLVLCQWVWESGNWKCISLLSLANSWAPQAGGLSKGLLGFWRPNVCRMDLVMVLVLIASKRGTGLHRAIVGDCVCVCVCLLWSLSLSLLTHPPVLPRDLELIDLLKLSKASLRFNTSKPHQVPTLLISHIEDQMSTGKACNRPQSKEATGRCPRVAVSFTVHLIHRVCESLPLFWMCGAVSLHFKFALLYG